MSLAYRVADGDPNQKHEEVAGVIPMSPGHRVVGTCTCGWHSHSRTFAEHLADLGLTSP